MTWALSVPAVLTALPQVQMPCVNMPSSVNPWQLVMMTDREDSSPDYEDNDSGNKDDEFMFKED